MALHHAGGSVAEFNRAWPQLKVEYLASKPATSRSDEVYQEMKRAGPLRPGGRGSDPAA